MSDPHEAEMVTARVMDRLNHDGTDYQPGAEIVVTMKQFDSLVALNILSHAAKVMAPSEPLVDALDLSDLADLVRGAIGKLEAADFAANGVPKVAAVRAALPQVRKGITAEIVAAVWADLKSPA